MRGGARDDDAANFSLGESTEVCVEDDVLSHLQIYKMPCT